MAKNARFKTQGQRNRTSKREREVYELLKQIFPLAKWYSEYPLDSIIPECNNSRLRVDLWCPTFNIIFEIDGEMHNTIVDFSNSEESFAAAKDALEEQKKRDNYKDRLCADAEVRLIRIPYKTWDKLKNKEEKHQYLLELL